MDHQSPLNGFNASTAAGPSSPFELVTTSANAHGRSIIREKSGENARKVSATLGVFWPRSAEKGFTTQASAKRFLGHRVCP